MTRIENQVFPCLQYLLRCDVLPAQQVWGLPGQGVQVQEPEQEPDPLHQRLEQGEREVHPLLIQVPGHTGTNDYKLQGDSRKLKYSVF